MSFFPTEGFEWFRKHPITTTLAAMVAAAYSLTKYNDEFESEIIKDEPYTRGKVQLKNSTSSETSINNCKRGISWSDENGGKLTEVLHDNSSTMGFMSNTEDGSIESMNSYDNRHNHEQLGEEPLDGKRASGENSPNFGWFVSITPPEKLYAKQKKGG